MLKNESEEIKKIIHGRLKSGQVLLNLGSSSYDFRFRIQPHVGICIDNTCADIGVRLINVDQRVDEGVDLVGDLRDASFLNTVKAISADLVLCANIFEHLSDRRPLINTLSQIVLPGKSLIVTGPYCFPYHPDPIDTGYRPDAQRLAAEFALFELIAWRRIECGSLKEFTGSGWPYCFWRLRSIIKGCYSTLRWRGNYLRMNSSAISAFVCEFRRK